MTAFTGRATGLDGGRGAERPDRALHECEANREGHLEGDDIPRPDTDVLGEHESDADGEPVGAPVRHLLAIARVEENLSIVIASSVEEKPVHRVEPSLVEGGVRGFRLEAEDEPAASHTPTFASARRETRAI